MKKIICLCLEPKLTDLYNRICLHECNFFLRRRFQPSNRRKLERLTKINISIKQSTIIYFNIGTLLRLSRCNSQDKNCLSFLRDAIKGYVFLVRDKN